MIRACVFDLDGTLIHSLPTVLDYANHTLRQLGFAPLTDEQGKVCIRYAVPRYYHEILCLAGADEATAEQLAGPFREIEQAAYHNAPTTGSVPYDGVVEMLRALQAAGIKTAVLSNKPETLVQCIADALLPGLLDLALGQIDGRRSKPHPGTMLSLMEKLEVEKDECLFVGDTNVDIKLAQNAGVSAVAAAWGYMSLEGLEALGPDVIINHPGEVISLALGKAMPTPGIIS